MLTAMRSLIELPGFALQLEQQGAGAGVEVPTRSMGVPPMSGDVLH